MRSVVGRALSALTGRPITAIAKASVSRRLPGRAAEDTINAINAIAPTRLETGAAMAGAPRDR